MKDRNGNRVLGKTRWRRFGLAYGVSMGVIVGVLLLAATGAIALPLTITGQPFTLHGSALHATGFTQYGDVDLIGGSTPVGVAVTVIDSLDDGGGNGIVNLTQTVWSDRSAGVVLAPVADHHGRYRHREQSCGRRHRSDDGLEHDHDVQQPDRRGPGRHTGGLDHVRTDGEQLRHHAIRRVVHVRADGRLHEGRYIRSEEPWAARNAHGNLSIERKHRELSGGWGSSPSTPRGSRDDQFVGS
jgi:hypothetical protein